MALLESGEMYLETILILLQNRKNVRSIDVADYMSFSKPAVSRGLAKLKQDNYIAIDNDGYITLTKNGQSIAEKIYERHTILTRLLVQLGVDEQTAAADACRIEHVISDKTFNAIKEHNQKYGQSK